MCSRCLPAPPSTWKKSRTSSITAPTPPSRASISTVSRKRRRSAGFARAIPTSSVPSSARSTAAPEAERYLSRIRDPIMTTSERIHNFSAGPAVLPEPVLRKAQEAIWNIAGSGIGIMEHSHRGKVFDRVIKEAEQACRELAGIPDNYRVLFLQGGASLQFAMVPMNFLSPERTADYLVTGIWSQKAVKEAKPVGKVHIAASGESTNFDRIPRSNDIRCSATPAYVHLTTNNTIYGTQWPTEPPVPQGVPLVADTSSDMYSRPIDIRKYGLIYAGAQKNLGPSGVVLVIIRNDLVEAGPKTLPTMLQYRTFVAENSLYNTPP